MRGRKEVRRRSWDKINSCSVIFDDTNNIILYVNSKQSHQVMFVLIEDHLQPPLRYVGRAAAKWRIIGLNYYRISEEEILTVCR